LETGKKFILNAQARIGREKYQTIVNSGHHSIVVDEPETNGGKDTAPDPYALLLASLGSCTAITLRMYIDRKMWVIDEITVNLDLFKNGLDTIIERQLLFKGELTEQQKTRLTQIADACPIHKLLTGNILIETRLG